MALIQTLVVAVAMVSVLIAVTRRVGAHRVE